jgi:integrase
VALIKRGGVWYFKKKILGELYRLSTGFPVATQRTKDAAAHRASELETEIRSGKHGWTKTVPTLGGWWTLYEKTYSSQKAAPERDRQIMAHALPFFGPSTPLDQIKKTDCLRYLNKRRGDVQANPKRKTPGKISEDTVQRERSFLQALWQQAIEDGHEITNPWKGIERKAYTVRERLLTDDEQKNLLARLSPRFQRFVLFLLGTGVRLDECRGIASTDLNLPQRFVRVTGKFSKTRTVPIPAELVPMLQQQLDDDGQLWTQNPQRLREVIREAAVRAGIPHLGPHTMRHTFGWRYLKSGGDIYKLSKILGHAGVAVTERHYAHLLKDDLRDAMDRVDLGIRASVKAVVRVEEEAVDATSVVVPFERV